MTSQFPSYQKLNAGHAIQYITDEGRIVSYGEITFQSMAESIELYSSENNGM